MMLLYYTGHWVQGFHGWLWRQLGDYGWRLVVRPILFSLDPEDAHEFAVHAVRAYGGQEPWREEAGQERPPMPGKTAERPGMAGQGEGHE